MSGPSSATSRSSSGTSWAAPSAACGGWSRRPCRSSASPSPGSAPGPSTRRWAWPSASPWCSRVVRLVQRSSLKFVAQAVVPTAIAALIATRTGRAEDVFLPGILYNGALAVVSLLTVAVRRPLIGFVVGAALEDPTGWIKDRGLVRMSSRLTLVLAVPYVLRFVVQLPLFLAGQVLWLAVAKVVLGWPLLLAALFVIGLLLSRGRTPIEQPTPAPGTEGGVPTV